MCILEHWTVPMVFQWLSKTLFDLDVDKKNESSMIIRYD